MAVAYYLYDIGDADIQAYLGVAGDFITSGSLGSFLGIGPTLGISDTSFEPLPPVVPMGDGVIAVLTTVPSVPSLDAGITSDPQGPVSGTVDLRDNDQIEDEVVSWADWAALGNPIPDDFGSYPHASDYPGLIADTGDSIVISTGDAPVSIFDDIYGIADDLLGGWLPGGPVSPFDPPTILPIGDILAPPTVLPPTVLPPPIGVPVVTSSTCSTGPSPVWKKVCGVYKWVYPKRRRRKALVTKQDAQGLATLKGIVGVGKTMDTWIATHS